MRYETRDGAVWLTLESPETANAITLDGMRDLADGLDEAESDDAPAVVLTGEGEQFCSGADLDTLASIEDEEDAREFADALVGALRRIEEVGIPVIAAINGDAYGAGFEFVVACDLAVAIRDARFAMPETQLGVSAPLTGERVAATAGRKRVSELALTCEPIDADTAEAWGVLNRAVTQGALESTVERYVSCIRTSHRGAARATKERINSEPATYDEIRERTAEHFADPETQERFREAAEGG